MNAADKPCNETGCDRPRHITKGGKVCRLCTMHLRHYEKYRRVSPSPEAARKADLERRRELYREKRAAGTFVKWKPPVVEFHCERCRAVMPNARYDCCADCRRADDIARAARKRDARLEREAAVKAKREAKAAPKRKAIDYATSANIERYVACKECVRYVLRTEVSHRWFCSDACFRANNNRRRGYEDRYTMGDSL